MNVKQLFLLSTLCLTMGATQASAQGFLNKLKVTIQRYLAY